MWNNNIYTGVCQKHTRSVVRLKQLLNSVQESLDPWVVQWWHCYLTVLGSTPTAGRGLFVSTLHDVSKLDVGVNDDLSVSAVTDRWDRTTKLPINR